MSLRSLPLRSKLIIALVLPMLLVTVLIGSRVGDSIDDRRIATSQEQEAARLDAIADFADAVGAESVITNDPTATSAQLIGVRGATDAAHERLGDPSLDLDSGTVGRLDVHYGDIVEIRNVVGDSPDDISLRFQVEAYLEPQVGEADSSNPARSIPSALRLLSELPTSITGEFEFTEAAIVDVETAQLLADYELVQRLRSDHVNEVSTLLQLIATPPGLIDQAALTKYRSRVVATDVSRSLISDYAAEDLVAGVADSGSSAAGVEYAVLRDAAGRTGPGEAQESDVTAVNRSGAVVAEQYGELGDGVVEQIRAQAERTAGAATRSLVLSLIVGAWMLIVAGLVLRFLYRSIRAPLQRLTEQSQHIANVELPYVVAAMRDGELDVAPDTTDLVADAKDEIGELVHAFNDMHRTAVELAAEQAGSRRIVADMFVNLGRRNQRLVNRLLKRLTNLEHDERDPDKLAGLYEIDHLVTRMRRNAESLLVLAGASQSRKWDRPVEAYDIARAALSEVEGYERVEIVANDDFEVHGDAVADLTHLLAEVVENALSFSPPSAPVEITLRRLGDEHFISVRDAGVGMTEAQLAEANQRILRAGAEDETPSEFLGHYVIGRLAARHGIDVSLSTGTGGSGLVVDVVVPLGAVVPRAAELVDRFDHDESSAPELAAAPEPVDEPVARPVEILALAAPAAMTDQLPVAAGNVDGATDGARPEWSSVAQEVRRPVRAESDATEPFAGQPTRVPAPDQPTPSVPQSQMATPPVGSSFDYPPTEQIDPRQREMAPPPAPPAASNPEPSVPDEPPASSDLSAARSSADDAVEGALSAFGSARRTPGARLPDTSLIAAISGRMTLELPATPPVEPTAPATVPLTAPSADADEIRFQLSGFQSGTSRADREN